MTREEEKLLVKDLSARLPYGVKGIMAYKSEETITLAEIIPRCKMNPNVGNGSFCELGFDETLDCCVITEFKPYLRPLSSMTKDEINEFTRIDDVLLTDNPNVDYYFYCANIEQIDWLNAHHFDYRGLIPMGLALEAPENMYKEK